MRITGKIAPAVVAALLFLVLCPLFSTGQEKSLFFRHLTTNEGLSHNSVYSINEDDYGFMWIGTRSGLNRFDGYSFKIYDNNNSGLRNAYINTIFKDSRGRMWIGTQEGGLADITPRLMTLIHIQSVQAAQALLTAITFKPLQKIRKDGFGQVHMEKTYTAMMIKTGN